MAKQTGMGAAFYVGGNDISGDVNSLSKINGGPAALDVTDITQSAYSRLGGLRDGGIDFAVYFDPATAHPVLSALPTADVVASFVVPPIAAGCPVAACNSKQINYDWTRGTDGSLSGAVSLQADGFGLEWGISLTGGKRTDTGATTSTAFDNGAGQTFGAQAYLQVFSFSGTDATVTIQHATTSGGSYSSLIAFSQITTAPQAQRVTAAGTVNEFFKVATTTSGGFTSLVFAVAIVVNTLAVAF